MTEKEFNWKEEFEKVEASQEEFKEHYRSAVIRINVELEARALGMIYPDLAVKLVDLSGCSFDEDSNVVTGAHEAIENLAARSPYLFAPQIKQGVAPPKRFGGDGFLEMAQKELGMKKF
jgi:hypothetical protein